MNNCLKVDLCVIGAGSGGLSVAAGAAQLGSKVALIEADKMGGDCLNYGCVPSKALLAAAKNVLNFGRAYLYGLENHEPDINIAKIMEKIQGVISNIAKHDSVERFEKMGVKVIIGNGQFKDEFTLMVNDLLIQADHFVIATGSKPTIPPIPGLDTIPYYTNETIFDLQQNPQHLIIIGAGPIGCEMAQAFSLLKIPVTLIETYHMLPHDEPDLVKILRRQFVCQGMVLYENAKVQHLELNNGAIEVIIEHNNKQQRIQGSHLMVATGRKPNVAHLNLEAAKVEFSTKGVKVDNRLRSTNKRIYAIGDAIGSYQFTHVANYHAGIVIRNILFKLPAKAKNNAIPWVTYTIPELAHVGLLSNDLKQNPKFKILNFALSENDRAQTEHETLGKIKVITNHKGHILGVSILGHQAGELLLPWVMAINQKKSLSDFANTIVPYPTLSEASKSIASQFYQPILFSRWVKILVKLLRWIKT